MTIQLNPTQHAVLAHAAQNTNGKITWFPDNVKGGARQKVLTGLFNRALITSDGANHFVAAEGYDALGLTRSTAALVPVVAPLDADSELEATVASVEPQWAQAAQPVTAPKPLRKREHSKQANIIGMLRRPQGATVAQICARTTVRGTFAGASKKKLGLTITSSNPMVVNAATTSWTC
ncbi:DUF3489 domain-containing protein [Rhodoferax sp.]|uniref:DUF3489 domain-containing protein n=1 Tax=Rhodoferax sp. TaxID=50421 RepID=UPI00345B6D22